MMRRRRIDVMCVQEVRWKGERNKVVKDGYKIYYMGEQSCRNGVSVIMSASLVDSVVEVKKCSSRLMKIKLVWGGIVLNVVCTYAPQVGLREKEKEEFWAMFDVLISEIKGTEKLIVGGDLNGHVGRENIGFSTVHGGWGYGSRAQKSETILEEAVAHGLVVLNTIFKKKDEYLVTYESGGRRTQVNYIMTRMQDKRSCINCEVLPGEKEEQHKMVVADLLWRVRKQRKRKTGLDTVKWGKLRSKEGELWECLLSRVNWSVEGDVETVWGSVTGEVRKICREVLGVSKGGKAMVNKDTWWWEESVQMALKGKKRAYREWKTMHTQELLSQYKEAKKTARRAVAMAKGKKFEELYEKLGTKEGEKDVYKIANWRSRPQKDVGNVRCVRDERGEVLVMDDEILIRWRRYFEALMNEGVETVEQEEESREGGG